MNEDHPRSQSEHRAKYTFERGIWHATCRSCGYRVSDPVRRRAASEYREHLKKAPPPVVIELRESRAAKALAPGLISAMGESR